MEGRELLQRKDRDGGSAGKACPLRAAGEKEKEWKHPQGIEQEREKGEGFGTIRTLETGEHRVGNSGA